MAALFFYGRYLRGPLLLVLLALAADKLLFYGALPLGSYLEREWDYAQAERAEAAGRDDEALFDVRRALLDTRHDARYWRLAARVSDRLCSPEASYCWQQADRLEPGSATTELALAEAALRNGETALARAALGEVSPEAQASERYALDAGQLERAEGRPERAGYWFGQVEAGHPTDAGTLFVLADWHGGVQTPADQARARAILTGLAKRSAERLAALRNLVDLDLRQRDGTAARTDEAALLSMPGLTYADRVRQLDLAESAPALDGEIAALLRTSSTVEAAQTLDWMTAHGRAEQALIWIRSQDESWQDDLGIGAARARCLAALGDWEHLRDDQLASVWPGHEAARWMWLARSALELGDGSEARAAWHYAVGACSTPEEFETLDRAADSFPGPDGGSEEKAEVWTAMSDRYPDQEGPLRSLLRYQLRRGDLVAAQALSERLAALAPGDVTLAAKADLISLLRNGTSASVSAHLQRLVQASPENPDVATAAAYSFYLQGRFDDALATLGALDPADLRAPERAAYLGELLAAAGPVDQAQEALDRARAQSDLLEAQRASVDRALDLVAYRRAMAGWLHGADEATRGQARDFFTERAATGQAVYLIGESVVLAYDPAQAAEGLSRIDSLGLNEAELRLYEGAVLNLAGQSSAGRALLELAEGSPAETDAARWHRTIEEWWTLVDRGPFDARLSAGLLTAYRGLQAHESSDAFWQSDEAREMALTRTALQRGELAGAVQERLEALLRHVPATAELEAQVGYALFLQGRIESGRERLALLSPAELAEPGPAFYDAAIQRACRETKRAPDGAPGPSRGLIQISEEETP